MKITVDRKKCISCGLCVTLASKTFELDNVNISTVKKLPHDSDKIIVEAAKNCPVGAIRTTK